MKEYNGLKAELIEFEPTNIIATSTASTCRSIVAFSQAPIGTAGWEQCQEAIQETGNDQYGEYWIGEMGPNPDV